MVHLIEICTGAELDLHGTTSQCWAEHLPGNIFNIQRIIFGQNNYRDLPVLEYLPSEQRDRRNTFS